MQKQYIIPFSVNILLFEILVSHYVKNVNLLHFLSCCKSCSKQNIFQADHKCLFSYGTDFWAQRYCVANVVLTEYKFI